MLNKTFNLAIFGNRASVLPGTKALLLLVSILLFSVLLHSQSPREQEHYEYIVELYYSGVYLDDVLPEIEAFRNLYPDSKYNQYLDYLRANVALKKGEYLLSQEIYRELLGQELHPDILADVYLNFAISSYYTKDYTQASQLLDKLEDLAFNSYYRYKVRVWRGRIYAIQGYYLSAEMEYVLALQDDPDEVRYDYFLVLLKLDRYEQARDLVVTIPREHPLYADYQRSWLGYLLTSGFYAEFDAHISRLNSLTGAINEDLRLLRVRKSLELEDYAGASILLEELETASELKTYYKAVVLSHTGQPAKADSLFHVLTNSAQKELAYLSYLERLKILFRERPTAAIMQLENFLSAEEAKTGDAHHLLGVFHYQESNYEDAILKFLTAADYELDFAVADRNAIMIADSYYESGNPEFAYDAYNRYLNQYPRGKRRDRALYRLGLMDYENNDLRQATLNLEKLLKDHPSSVWADEARYCLAEIYFLSSEYSKAAALLNDIELTPRNQSTVYLRLAQTFYYQEKFSQAKNTLRKIPPDEAGFDAKVLLAGIHFSLREYEEALAVYEEAEKLASGKAQVTEARSYRAYTLFYLKRYEDASELFYELSQDEMNADIYLYQAAKSASQGKEWQRALGLYERLLVEFPTSEYYLPVLAEVANINFNLGNYSESLDNWLNVLRRFTAHASVTDEELILLNEVFTGIEVCCRRLDDASAINRVADMIDSFRSDYIKFELEYIIVKLYADAELWDDLLQKAETLRSSLDLPENRRGEVELLMLESLVNLDRYEQADSLAGRIYQSTQSRESLIKWAEIAALTDNPELAMQRYLEAYAMEPGAELWLQMAKLSANNDFYHFEELWDLGSAHRKDHPEVQMHRIAHLFATGDLASAQALADTILDTEPNPWIRAQSELWLGRIAFERGDFENALRSFRKIRLLHSEFGEIHTRASYYYIISLIHMGALQEAQLTYKEMEGDFDEARRQDIQIMLQNLR
jgi:tetratricopeptide (TPR) repeat protein